MSCITASRSALIDSAWRLALCRQLGLGGSMALAGYLLLILDQLQRTHEMPSRLCKDVYPAAVKMVNCCSRLVSFDQSWERFESLNRLAPPCSRP